MAQYPKIESMGSIESIIFASLEVQAGNRRLTAAPNNYISRWLARFLWDSWTPNSEPASSTAAVVGAARLGTIVAVILKCDEVRTRTKSKELQRPHKPKDPTFWLKA